MLHLYLHAFKVIGGHQEVKKGVLRDYCDGKKFKEHTLFSVDSNALQLVLYYDELELCNVLGSRRKKHKIGNLIFSCSKNLMGVKLNFSLFNFPRNYLFVLCMYVRMYIQ